MCHNMKDLKFQFWMARCARRVRNSVMCWAAMSIAAASAADIVVDHANDSGVGSLRQGMSAIASGDRLAFQPILDGVTLVNSGTPLTLNAAGTLLDSNSITVNDSHAFTLAAPLTVDWKGTLTLNGVLSGSSTTSSLVNSGLGTLILANTNTYAGGTTINGGTIKVLESGSLSTGTLNVSNTIGAPTLALGDGLTLSNAISLSTALTFNSSAGTSNKLSGIISGAAAADALKTVGNGTLILSGTNTFIGGVQVTNDSTLKLTNSSALGTGTLSNAGVLTLDLASGLTVANKITLGNSIVTNVTSGTATLSGAIGQTVASQFTKTGAGTLILTGANTYTGGTLISAGTLQGNSSSLTGTITDNAALIFNQTGTGTFAGTINGTGDLTKNGNGTLIFSGTSNLTTTTDVNAGNLRVTGTVAGPVDVISAAAALSGTGSVGTVINSGFVQPGTSSIGELTVNGNFTQNSAGTTEIKINSAGNVPGVNNDHLKVTGQATLGGTLNVLAVGGGAFSTATQYTILNAPGGVSGQFTQASSSMPAYGVNVTYNANDVVIKLQSTTSLLAAATTMNQASVGSALDTLSLTASGPLYTMINNLGIQTVAQQQQSMDQLSGEVYGGLQTLALEAGNQYQQRVTSALVSNGKFLLGETDSVSDGTIVRGQSPESDMGRGWQMGYGTAGRIRSDGNGGSLNYNQGGGLIGLDLGADETGRLGFAGGASYTGYRDGFGASGNLTSYQFGGYGIKHDEFGYILATGNYGSNTYSTTRHVVTSGLTQTINSNFSGTQAGASLETGLNLTMGVFHLQPLVGLQYLYLFQQPFDESGGAAALVVDRTRAHSLRANVGARFLTDAWVTEGGTVWTPYSHLRFVSDLLSNDRIISASFDGAPAGGSFQSHGTRMGQNYAIIGQGMELRFNEFWSLLGGVDLMYSNRIAIATGSVTSVLRW